MKIAIILRPNNQAPGLTYETCGRIAALQIEYYLKLGYDVTLYSAKPCDVACEVVMPKGVINTDGSIDVNQYEWLGYAIGVVKDLNKRNYDIVHNHDDPYVFSLSSQLKLPMLTTLHGRASKEKLKCFTSLPGIFNAVSKKQMSLYQKIAYPDVMNFLGVVYNGISLKHPFSNVKQDYLFAIGRIEAIKGFELAIELSKRAGMPLVVAGNITDQLYFEREVKPKLTQDLSVAERKAERAEFIDSLISKPPNPGQVVYLGAVTETERDEVMKSAKALVFPVKCEESFGLVLIEAGITGTPVLALNRGAVPEIIIDGETGFYRDSLDELVRCVPKLNTISPYKCRIRIAKNFNSTKMCEAYLEFYELIIREKLEEKLIMSEL